MEKRKKGTAEFHGSNSCGKSNTDCPGGIWRCGIACFYHTVLGCLFPPFPNRPNPAEWLQRVRFPRDWEPLDSGADMPHQRPYPVAVGIVSSQFVACGSRTPLCAVALCPFAVSPFCWRWRPKRNTSTLSTHLTRALLSQGPGGGGGGIGTRPRWLALLACGGVYWPLTFGPSAMTSRHPHFCGHPHCRGHPPAPGGGGGINPECNFCPWRPPLTACSVPGMRSS